MKAPSGYRRAGGAVGVRNHLLVLPSVVCSTHVAGEIAAAADGVGVVHQHGCLQVGDDLQHSERLLSGVAVNPNVGAVLVVSLGCETLRGAGLAKRIGERGQTVELVGIQAAGGSERAVADGRAAAARMSAELAAQEREPMATSDLVVGIDAGPEDELAAGLGAALADRGVQVIAPPDGLRGAEAHVSLARLGAQLLLSLPPAEEAPLGFAVVPVVAVGRDSELHRALAGDFDLILDDGATPEAAALVFERLIAHANGEETSAERRGARDFVLHRLAVTM